MIHHPVYHSAYHPAFQSLVLPLGLALLGIAGLRAGLGARHAAWGGLLGLLGALAWLPGFEWPAITRTQKLPWIVLAGWGLAALDAACAGRRHRWEPALLAALPAWAAAGLWLAGTATSPLALGGAAMLGWVMLTLLVWGRGDASATGVAATAVLLLGSLGLAGLAAMGGSLLLAQLALMLASVLAAVLVVVGRAGLQRASGWVVPPALLLSFALAWLSIAWCWVLAATDPASLGARSARLAILALVFLIPAMLSRWQATACSSPGPRRAAVLLLAAGPVVLALGWPGGVDKPTLRDTAADSDDPYLTPPHGNAPPGR